MLMLIYIFNKESTEGPSGINKEAGLEIEVDKIKRVVNHRHANVEKRSGLN
jgi:hypothetical protein